MNRRNFLAAGLTGMMTTHALAEPGSQGVSAARQFLELRQYHLRSGSNKSRVGDFLREIGVAALNRVGVKPVGVFSPVYGPNQPTLYVLLVHPSLDSILTLPSRLMDDTEFRVKGSAFIDATLPDPSYVRYESSLMVTFSHMPQVEVPTFDDRILELRIYESHSLAAGKKKIEMFNEGGEIAIFRKTGLNPVFFGETIIGRQQPNLTYMLAFKDMAHRDKQWQVFRDDPDWRRLRQDPTYRDTVSNITDIILRPTNYSQI